jgi:small subunit ribosomal protein S21e
LLKLPHSTLLYFVSFFSILISSATNRLITPKDHASIQLNIGEVDAEGRYTGKYVPFAIAGCVRFASEADNSLCRLATEQGLLKSVWSAQN